MKSHSNRFFQTVRRLSTAVWCVCLLVLVVHGGCGGGTSGTGVKDLLVSGLISGGDGALTVELVGPGGTVVAVAAVANGQWSVTLPDGTEIANIVVQTTSGSILAPPEFTVVVSAATTVVTTLPPGGGSGSSSVSQSTPTPTPTNVPTSVPTSTPTVAPTIPGRPTQTATSTPTGPGRQTARPTSTPTPDPTEFCKNNPNRPACNPTATPTPVPTSTPTVCSGRGCS
jgi:hypothetical protein